MIRARLATTPGYQSIMSLVYPYDMWSRSVALYDLSDVVISLLIYLGYELSKSTHQPSSAS